MNFRSIKDRALLIGLAILIGAIAAGFIFLSPRDSRQDFQAGVENSVAYQTINVTAETIWDVQIEIAYSDRQKQAYLDKVSRRIVSLGSAQAWRPIQRLPLSLTVSKVENGSSKLVHSETIESESLDGGGNHAGFLTIAELHLDPGKYVVAIRTLKGDPALREFEARLLVNRRWP